MLIIYGLLLTCGLTVFAAYDQCPSPDRPDDPCLHVYFINDRGFTTQSQIKLEAKLESHPSASFIFLKDGKEINSNDTKYNKKFNDNINAAQLTIRNLTIEDIGNYTIVADNGHQMKNDSFFLRKKVQPKMNFGRSNEQCVAGRSLSVRCVVSGYPLPTVYWKFTDEQGMELTLKNITRTPSVTRIYEEIAHLDVVQCSTSGNLTCIAENEMGQATADKSVLIFEADNGFGIQLDQEDTYKYDRSNKTLFLVRNERAVLKCIASKYKFDNVTWQITESSDWIVKYSQTRLSYEATLVIESVSPSEAGTLTCSGFNNNVSINESIWIHVDGVRGVQLVDGEYTAESVNRNDNFIISCTATGAPLPNIYWEKDGKPLLNGNMIENVTKHDRFTITSSIEIHHMQEKDEGTYLCKAKNKMSSSQKISELSLKVDVDKKTMIAFGIIVPILLVLIVYQTIKVQKQKKLLKLAGLTHFKDGNISRLDPKLPINEQADLLPYNNKYEIDRKQIIIDRQLGNGEFGVVSLASYDGSQVAIKQTRLKENCEQIRILHQELKILMHTGLHNNIVRLIGACTKNVTKLDITLVMEYCELGSLKDYFKKSEFREMNIETDYEIAFPQVSVDDLTEWSFQIAFGMEYLASMKILHGDLATRNILLKRGKDESVILKICDFGLSRALPALGDVYTTLNRNILPLKWLAIESIKHGTYSTQSDVWAFGVVMWEIFSYGRTPYTDGPLDIISHYEYLKRGSRLEKPEHADEHVYELMMRCWSRRPKDRPEFTDLKNNLGDLLPGDLLNKLVEMNRPNVEKNAQEKVGQSFVDRVGSNYGTARAARLDRSEVPVVTLDARSSIYDSNDESVQLLNVESALWT